MSDRLIHAFLGDTPIHLDAEAEVEGEPKLLWKAVLRTGTWKLRPGGGGVKLKAPLKIFRDQAPKGHISLAALKANFDAGAKEYVTVPQVHADGTTSDGGFVKKLVIQDVPGEDGSGVKESLLWAGMEITDSALKTKLDERSIRGVSGGILFDYERTEDAKKFDQILSHVMVTNSPWINGTGDFKDSLPEGVMASEDADLPMGEVEFQTRSLDSEPNLPVVHMGEPERVEPATPEKAVWNPEHSLEQVRGRVRQELEDWRKRLMASLPASSRYESDWSQFKVTDVSLSGDAGTALVSAGENTWAASFKYDGEHVEISPFPTWTPQQERVAASEDQPAPKTPPPSARPAVRTPAPPAGKLGLQEAQAARAERMNLSITPTTGGSMPSRLSELLSGVELSAEQQEAIAAEDARIARYEADEAARIERDRQAEVTAYCGEGGKLEAIGLDDPGIKKYVRNVLLSDDGQPAIELSEHLDGGQKTTGVAKTATDVIKGFIDVLPKKEDGKVSLSEQARRLPDDPKPPADNKPEEKSPQAEADALLAEWGSEGLGDELAISTPKGA